ncbi:MAG: hypothetical protein AAF533_21990 [Acidobacteriota bacterium]
MRADETCHSCGSAWNPSTDTGRAQDADARHAGRLAMEQLRFSDLPRPDMEARPKSWLSWSFLLEEDGKHFTELEMSSWREAGRFSLGGAEHVLRRDGPLGGLLGGPYVLESKGRILATARKPSVFKRGFLVEHGGLELTLEPRGIGRREFVLGDDRWELGTITPVSSFTYRSVVDLPRELPQAVRVFVFWVVANLWRREAESA